MDYKFKMEDVRARLAHSKAADERGSLYGQEGTDGPGIWLVKDQGTYIMSNASEMKEEGKDGRIVNYAEGFDPDKQEFEEWWVGGDDYVELLSEEMLDRFVNSDSDTLVVSITETQMIIDAA